MKLIGDGKGIVEILCVGFEPLLTEKEYFIYTKKRQLKRTIMSLEYSIKLLLSKSLYEEGTLLDWIKTNICQLRKVLNQAEEELKEVELEFKEMLKANKSICRELYSDREWGNVDQYRNIAIFESDVLRKLECDNYSFSDKLVTVITYYTEIFESVIHNGFTINGNKYIFFTAGAGATRQKKSTFIREDEFYRIQDSLYCGLRKEHINEKGGMNTNKYLAYTALGMSNTQLWQGFDIRKAIVVNDIEFKIPNQTVRHIYTQSPEDRDRVNQLREEIVEANVKIKQLELDKKELSFAEKKEVIKEIKTLKESKKIKREEIDKIQARYHTCTLEQMDVDIPFTDGFGLCLKEKGSFMIRLPFIKGLMSYVPLSKFKTWCKSQGIRFNNKITDIYGKEYNIEKDKIEYIFTESQFKMAKYFDSWQEYQDNFEKFGCSACKTNVEEKDMKLSTKTNYQVLQTLTTEMGNCDLYNIMKEDIDMLNELGNGYNALLKLVNVEEDENDNTSYLKKSLARYPELFNDIHMKSYVSNLKESVVKKLRSGKTTVNGAYTFIIPDTIACLQWWFLGERDLTKLGFIKQGTVRCSLFDDGEEIDCLRSPHLDHAHCIRIVDNSTKDWYQTQGLYVGVQDNMSKFLVYDNDGDKALVHNNKTIIKCAKAFQDKYGMIPNNYTMAKARPQMLTNDNLLEGLLSAYHHGNIGTPSNDITKIWAKLDTTTDRQTVETAIEVIALKCADVNFVIDYAKTLWKPDLNKKTKEMYKQYGTKDVPHFFIYAKDKRKDRVEPIGTGNIDRIRDLVNPPRIVYKNLNGKYDFSNLLYDKKVDIKSETALEIIEMYELIKENMSNRKSNMVISSNEDEKRSMFLEERLSVSKTRENFVKTFNQDIRYIADVIMKHEKYCSDKGYAWTIFGKEYFENICNHIPENSKFCEVCGDRFEYNKKAKLKPKYCQECAKEIKNEQNKGYYHEK